MRLGAGVVLGRCVGEAPDADAATPGLGDGSVSVRAGWQAAAIATSRATPTALVPMTKAYTSAPPAGSARLADVREEAIRIADRLEATLRIPDSAPTAIVVIAHPLPTHGGTMRNPVVAAIARACAERGWYALRFNFRGVGASAGEWSGGAEEWHDVGHAVEHARGLAPGKPLGVSGYSFGALMTLKWLASGGRADAVALVGVALRSVSLGGRGPRFASEASVPLDLPPIPDGTFIVSAEQDQFGNAAEVRETLPRARIAEVEGVDHYFVGKRDEVGRLVADELARTLG